MGKSMKGGLNSRRKTALKNLEEQYERFKSAGEDKKPWETTRNGYKKVHPGRKFDQECARLQEQIDILKKRVR